MPRQGSKSSLMGWEEAQWGLLPIFLCLPWMTNSWAGRAPLEGSFLMFAALMAGSDLASRRIPNKLTIITALWGLAWAFSQAGLPGLGRAALGGAICFGLMALFFFFGMVGAGDVKALAALGTFVAPWSAVQLFSLTVLCGGALALGFLCLEYLSLSARRGDRPPLRMVARGMTMPYGLAIAAAAFVFSARGGLS